MFLLFYFQLVEKLRSVELGCLIHRVPSAINQKALWLGFFLVFLMDFLQKKNPREKIFGNSRRLQMEDKIESFVKKNIHEQQRVIMQVNPLKWFILMLLLVVFLHVALQKLSSLLCNDFYWKR